MKTRLFTAVMLLISIVTFAQPSRRGDSERRDQKNNSDRNISSRQDERKTQSENRNQNVDHRNFRNDNIRTGTDHKENREYNVNRGNRDFGRNDRHEEFTASVRRMPEREHATGRVDFRSNRDNHVSYYSTNHYRRPFVRDYHRHYEPLEIRRSRFPYRTPVRAEIIWTNSMFRDYRFFYPEVHVWRYPIGHRIILVSAYDARDYIGEVASIYGKVADAYYNYDTDEYFLYLGDYFPNQDFSVVIPGNEARRFSSDPINYFLNQHLSVTGYVNNFDGKPEIQVRSSSQIGLY